MGHQDHAVTLKEWAKIAIAKHSRKMLKYEAEVLKDKDPEDLHQMRVGMRRLRSAIVGFAIALDLPQTANERNIAKIGRALGKLRDLDVLLAALEDDYRPILPKAEQKSLDKVIKSLLKQRKKALKQVRETLNSELYLDLTQGLQIWLEQPLYQTIGDLSIYPVLPDLLLPQISQLLLHPGWLVGIKLKEGSVQIPESLDKKAIKQLLEAKEPILHDLRKVAKKTRYNLELFSPFYGETYSYYVKQIEQIQEILGQIQDCYVLRKILEKILQSEIAEQMPKLAKHFTNTRYGKWQEWQVLQEEFLEDKTRHELRQTIQQPIVSKN
ncbi:MAG: CHAD domain-containing protein [Xenococcus sp. (in: cyanobacteria)]